ncbi:MAG: ABC transporter permease [Deltaproteobacteria bacterium]|nr:ABC transporter permease [Deltaproteobacteria bacterium]
MLFEHFAEIINVLRRNKLRTLLTALSVSWGMLMLALLLGAGNGLENGVRWEFRRNDLATIWVWTSRTSIAYAGRQPGRDIKLTNDDYEAIKREIPGVKVISGKYSFWGEFQVKVGTKHSAFTVNGVHPGLLTIEQIELLRGRFINQADINHRRKIAIIGSKVSEILFAKKNPLGELIEIRSQNYHVVGEFADEGSEADQRTIYVPITTTQLAYQEPNRIHALAFTVGNVSVTQSQHIAEQVLSMLRIRHHVAPNDLRAIQLYNNLKEYNKIMQIILWVRVFMWIVGAGTLLAGVVGISNIMLIAVEERTREFGIRRALGATFKSIVGTVMVEAALITTLSGYAGLVSGVFLIELAGSFLKNTPYMRSPSVDIGVTLVAAGLLVLAGIFAGLFPALRAARINPVEALREGQ